LSTQPVTSSIPRAVIFDVDGVLVDSLPAHFVAFQRLGERLGVPFTRDLLDRTLGQHNATIFPMWLGDDLTPRRLTELADEKEALYRSVAIEALQPIPGSIDLVRALHDAGMPLAVGSSGPRDNVALALAKLGILQYFGAVVTGDDVTRGKPAPDIFLLAAARLRVDPWTCVVIEDAEQGVEAALAAGMRVVAVTTSLPAERLRKATRVVASLRDLTPTDLLAPDQPLPTHPT
jgi:beta-phosphoglucomutase